MIWIENYVITSFLITDFFFDGLKSWENNEGRKNRIHRIRISIPGGKLLMWKWLGTMFPVELKTS